MTSPGAGSSKIVLVGGRAAPVPDEPAMTPPPRPLASTPARASGWTPRRLAVGAVLGAIAVIGGVLLFKADFGEFGKADSPLLAIGFGLFAIGMLVFFGSIIGLLGTGVSTLAATRGWGIATIAILAPPAAVWLLYLAGAVGYAIPASITLVAICAVVVALK